MLLQTLLRIVVMEAMVIVLATIINVVVVEGPTTVLEKEEIQAQNG